MKKQEILNMIFIGLVAAEMVNGKSELQAKKDVKEYMKSEKFAKKFNAIK